MVKNITSPRSSLICPPTARRRLRCAAVLSAGLLISCGEGATSDGISPPPRAHEAEVAGLVGPLVTEGWAAGIVVGLLLADGSTVVYGFGSTTQSGGPAPDELTVFEIGSITKTLTGLALATMVDEGTVSLGQPVATLVPAAQVTVPSFSGTAVSLQHLATHTSALPRVPDNMPRSDPADPYADYGVTELYSFLNGYTLMNEPGTSYAYSNVAYGLLGHALALTDGVSFADHLTSRVTGPMALTDTTLSLSVEQTSRFSTGHDGDLNPVPHWHFDVLAPTGGLRSTPRDMLRYIAAQLGHAASPLDSAIAASQAPRFTLGSTTEMALGWGIEDARYLMKNGGTFGFASFAGFDLVSRTGVVVLINTESPYFLETTLGFTLLQMLAGESYPPIALPPAVSLSPPELARYPGSYSNGVDTVVIALSGDALYLEVPGSTPLRLYARALDDFYLRRSAVNVTFDCSSGTCDSFLVQGATTTETYNRL